MKFLRAESFCFGLVARLRFLLVGFAPVALLFDCDVFVRFWWGFIASSISFSLSTLMFRFGAFTRRERSRRFRRRLVSRLSRTYNGSKPLSMRRGRRRSLRGSIGSVSIQTLFTNYLLLFLLVLVLALVCPFVAPPRIFLVEGGDGVFFRTYPSAGVACRLCCAPPP